MDAEEQQAFFLVESHRRITKKNPGIAKVLAPDCGLGLAYGRAHGQPRLTEQRFDEQAIYNALIAWKGEPGRGPDTDGSS